MKKTLGRLGSVAAAVGLVAVGLVGTATSASADSHLTACAYHVAPTWQESAEGAAEDACIKALARLDYRDVDVTETSQDASNGKTLQTAWIPSNTDVDASQLPAVKDPYDSDWDKEPSTGTDGGSGDDDSYTCYIIDASVSCYPKATNIYKPETCTSALKAFAPEVENIKTTLLGPEAYCYGDLIDVDGNTSTEPEQLPPPPPPCWDSSLNNCPVGGALRFVAPKYAMVGVPVTMYAYASWRPDANSPAQPTNGTAVIRVDGEDYAGVEFVDGVAEWRFIPETEGMKEFTASGVLFSGLSGANAYIDTVPARTYVLEYDPAAYATALKKKRVEVGDTYVITDPNQARSYLEDRYEWSVSSKSDDVCAVYETKKGAVKAKFNGEGKCTVIWLDKESEESGKYTFIAKK
ncbi:MAG: hypothetical protein GKR85_09590 [Candidatus Nanopelagicales bacterium]|nr:hypothetical protein [Candidatus Nanopelagicales bacterium]